MYELFFRIEFKSNHRKSLRMLIKIIAVAFFSSFLNTPSIPKKEKIFRKERRKKNQVRKFNKEKESQIKKGETIW